MATNPSRRTFMIRPLLLAAISALLATPAMAENQTYTVSLGQRQLGTLQFDGRNSNETLLLSLNNAPLGIKNGTFEAVTRANGGAVDYLGKNRGSETRDIAIIRKANSVTSVTVTPQSEMTEMTDAAKVPAGVVFPPEIFAALANATSCPSPLAMYDGRRVVQLTTTEAKQDGASVTCEMSYRVVMGPGYVSPFHFKSFGMQLTYTARKLASLTMSGGGLKVNLIRQ